MMKRSAQASQPLLLSLALLLVYAPALNGPFVLDDAVNLAPAWQWINGDRSALQALFDNPSGPLGRPLAYLSLMANAAATGADAWSYKAFNLLLHACTAALALHVVRALLRVVRPDSGPFAALPIVAVWALHPMLVSTVMYTVQRMTMLAAIAQACALAVYLHARTRPEDPEARRRLFLLFPAVVAAGALCKETALLAPLLCLCIELTIFARAERPRFLRAFFGLFLALPVLAGLVWLALDRESWLAGYLGREFGLTERLLTQPRVLWSYAASWFWPTPVQLAMYRDGFATSGSLLAPATTWMAIAGWLALAGAAWAARRRLPLFSLGVLWFFASHSMEATIFPLEPYFEHRNYFAALGLTLAAFALADAARRWPQAAARAAACLLIVGLGAMTAQRAHAWRDMDALLASEGPPPGEISRRLQVDRAIRAFERGDRATRDAALGMLEGGNPGDAASAALWQAVFACEETGRLDAAAMAKLESNRPQVLTHNHVSALWLLARRIDQERCAGVSRAQFSALLDRWQTHARQPLARHAFVELGRMRAQLAARPR